MPHTQKLTELYHEFQRIALAERQMRVGEDLTPALTKSPDPEATHKLALHILEAAKSSTVPRGYNKRYGLSDESIVLESVAAHANLVGTIVSQTLHLAIESGHFHYDKNGDTYTDKATGDTYNYRTIMEAIRIHDLPENIIGDVCDNGATDEDAKRTEENQYFRNSLIDTYANQEAFDRAYSLFKEMRSDSKSSMGKFLYLADKISAIIMVLFLDSQDRSPMINVDAGDLSERDRDEMLLCDAYHFRRRTGSTILELCYKASEMWTIDFLHCRQLNLLDDTDIYTDLLIMFTLMVNGKWYNWREEQYAAAGIN